MGFLTIVDAICVRMEWNEFCDYEFDDLSKDKFEYGRN